MSKKKARVWGNWVSVGGLFDEGGQGRLYLVKNETIESNEIYVLKELKNPKRIKRFEREISAITNIKPHPNVIHLIDHGIYRDENRPCYVMPQADCSLVHFLSNSKNDINLAMKTFKFICAGVEHLHNAGIIHRDLKPENILIYNGIPKVADLGLCLLVDDMRLTATSEAVGPRFYMAPELEDGKNLNVDASADVYSLGKILYFMLSGGKVFSREKYRNPQYFLPKILNDPRYKVFSDVFRSSITTYPYERYSNASELQHEFKEVESKFSNHPRTKIFLKLGSSEMIIKGEYELSKLAKFNHEEWNELISFYQSIKSLPPNKVLGLAVKNVSEKYIDNLIKLLLENEQHLSESNLIRYSSNILLNNNPEKILLSMMRDDYVGKFLLLALKSGHPKVFDSVARMNIFTFQKYNQVIDILSKNYSDLSPKGKQNFLVASYKVEYQGKLVHLKNMLDDKELDDISFEAVIAGLCSLNELSILKHIAIKADNTNTKDQLGAYARGIILGSKGDTLKFFRTYDWKNPLMKTLSKVLDNNNPN